MTKTLKIAKNELAEIVNYKITFKYFTGYGANYRCLAGIKNYYFKVAAFSENEAIIKIKKYDKENNLRFFHNSMTQGYELDSMAKERKNTSYNSKTIVIH